MNLDCDSSNKPEGEFGTYLCDGVRRVALLGPCVRCELVVNGCLQCVQHLYVFPVTSTSFKANRFGIAIAVGRVAPVAAYVSGRTGLDRRVSVDLKL